MHGHSIALHYAYYNFAKIPTVTSRYPLWEGKEVDHESARINSQTGKTAEELGIVMPYNTIKPLFVALGASSDAEQSPQQVIDGYWMGLAKRSIQLV